MQRLCLYLLKIYVFFLPYKHNHPVNHTPVTMRNRQIPILVQIEQNKSMLKKCGPQICVTKFRGIKI